MPYTSRGKCVYKKDTGKKVGCTKGSVKKYLAALHANVHDEKKKPISFKEYFAKVTAANGSQQYADTTVTAEGEYAQGQDNVAQPGGYDTIGFKDNGPTFTVEKREKDKVIDSCIDFLEKLNKKGIPFDTEEMDKLLGQLQKMSDKLFSVGIEPVDIEATIKNPRMAYQYLIKGPSAPGGGGKGALQDLKDIKAGLLTDDESNPGGADVTVILDRLTSIDETSFGVLINDAACVDILINAVLVIKLLTAFV